MYINYIGMYSKFNEIIKKIILNKREDNNAFIIN